MKYTKYRDIPQMTRQANYRINTGWDYLEVQLESWDRPDMGSPLILSPDFQRCHRWNDEKRTKYIEYILRGGSQSKDLIFNCSSWGKNYNTPIELVDGKQRLESVRRFLRNEIKAFDSYYNEFTDKLRMVRCDFVMHVNDLQTRTEVLQFYLDLNSGGVAHTKAEIQKVHKLLDTELNKNNI